MKYYNADIESIKAKELIDINSFMKIIGTNERLTMSEEMVSTQKAFKAIEIAEKNMKDKSVKIFTEVIEKCFNCEDACLPQCGKDCLIYNFKELLNK